MRFGESAGLMELIMLLALVVGAVTLRKQHVRLKALEQDVVALRAGRVGAPLVAEPAVDDALLRQAEPALQDELVEPETEATPAGPWGQVLREPVDADERHVAIDQAELAIAPEETAKAAPARDFETALGTRWAVWVGGLALALGGVFLVRYSIEAGIFGPGVRLTAAVLFGLLLAAGGEFVRRRGFQSPVAGVNSAHVPAILTAAASFTLFAAIYAAHGIYGFIGPTPAFLLMALVAVATIGGALLHGQSLAGLGLLGSYLTPILVASDAPSIWTLFLYVALIQVAAIAVASLRGWRPLAAAAVTGAGLWSIVYLVDAFQVVAAPVVVAHLAGLAAIGFLWLGGGKERPGRVDGTALAAAIFLYPVATFLARGVDGAFASTGAWWAAVLLAAALGLAGWRARATPLLHAAGLATFSIASWSIIGGSLDIDVLYGGLIFDGVWLQSDADPFLRYSLVLAVLFLAGGVAMTLRTVAASPRRAAQWAFWAGAIPLWVMGVSWLTLGNLNIDWRFAVAGFALTGALVAAGEFTGRAEQPPHQGGWALSLLLAGSAVALCFALLVGFGPVMTTILTGAAAAVPAAATKVRNWPALGWLSAGLAFATLARIGIDPTIVGSDFLSTTPIFNVLLPAYFIPAAAFAYAAWQLARTTDGQPRLAMEAFSALFVLMGAAMLVRHAMSGGVIDGSEPTLAEQAIYTLIMIGGGAILLTLDQRAPSPVFRWGSIGLGVLSVFGIATAHLLSMNPLWTNESTGAIPVFNLLLLAYLLPAMAFAALAWRARGKRPDWYVTMLAAAGAVLAFAYVTLSVRRIFHGKFIGAWKGMDGLETYTYSAVWLALGVALLVVGVRFGSRALRLGSAVLVVTAVAKVFLYDMRELEGVLRALSFMGLGGVLIGIGLFYQKMLIGTRKAE